MKQDNTSMKSKIRKVIYVTTLQIQRISARSISNDRGDVPGWVLITVMTAGLVVAIWSVAGPELKSVLSNALHTVTSP